MGKVFFGSISYRTGIETIDDKRIKAHARQLRWLESLNLGDYHYYRVEQNYDSIWKSNLQSTLNMTSLEFSEALGPAKARNELLKILYTSDADWMVCMDDDRILYDHYAGYQFLEELGVNPAILSLASAGTLINGLVPQIRAFKKENARFGKVDKFWYMKKGIVDGCLQIVCIPNLVKFGKKPVYFDEMNCLTPDMPPEDVQFLIDWVSLRYPTLMNNMMIVYDLLPIPCKASTVYIGQDRGEVQAAQQLAVRRYIKEKTGNRIVTKKEFTRRKNPAVPIAIPRLSEYSPVDTDFDDFACLASISHF